MVGFIVQMHTEIQSKYPTLSVNKKRLSDMAQVSAYRNYLERMFQEENTSSHQPSSSELKKQVGGIDLNVSAPEIMMHSPMQYTIEPPSVVFSEPFERLRFSLGPIHWGVLDGMK